MCCCFGRPRKNKVMLSLAQLLQLEAEQTKHGSHTVEEQEVLGSSCSSASEEPRTTLFTEPTSPSTGNLTAVNRDNAVEPQQSTVSKSSDGVGPTQSHGYGETTNPSPGESNPIMGDHVQEEKVTMPLLATGSISQAQEDDVTTATSTLSDRLDSHDLISTSKPSITDTPELTKPAQTWDAQLPGFSKRGSGTITSPPTVLSDHPKSQHILQLSKPKASPTSHISDLMAWARRRSSRVQGDELNDAIARNTITTVLKNTTTIRLRHIPHQGSVLDRRLKQVDDFAKSIETLTTFMITIDGSCSEAVQLGSSLIWGDCQKILQMGATRLSSMEIIFNIFDQASLYLQQIVKDGKMRPKSTNVREILLDALVNAGKLSCEATLVSQDREHLSNAGMRSALDAGQSLSQSLSTLGLISSRVSLFIWSVVLEDISQSPNDDRGVHSDITFEIIRQWLGGHSKSLRLPMTNHSAYSRLTTSHAYSDWIGPVLKDFYNGKHRMLLISGEAGCGKSSLVGQIRDHLRFSLQTRNELLCVYVGPALHTPQSACAVLRSLLLQLLEASSGDAALFGILCRAYRRAQEARPDEEAILWSALMDIAGSRDHGLVIIIDGLDQIRGANETAIRVRDRLYEVLHQNSESRGIILSRPIIKAPVPWMLEYSVDTRLTFREVQRFIEHSVRHSTEFHHLSSQQKEVIVRRICERKIGVFLEARILIRSLEVADSYSEILQIIGATPLSLNGMLDQLILQLDLTNRDTVTLFSILVVAKESFTIAEMYSLSGIKPLDNLLDTCSGPQRSTMRSSYNALIEWQSGSFNSIHPTVLQRIRNLSANGTLPLTIPTAHKHIMTSCLVHIKSWVRDDVEPNFSNVLSGRQISFKQRLDQDRLLSYCVRSYLAHYQSSSLWRGDSNPKGLMELTSAHSDSALLSLAEYWLWSSTQDMQTCEKMLLDALSLRKLVFGDRCRSGIQSLANLSLLAIKIGSYAKAVTHLLEAWPSSIAIFGGRSKVCKELAKAIVETVSVGRMKAAFEVPPEVGDIYRYLQDLSQSERGDTHPETLRYAEELASFYLECAKYDQAAAVYRSIYETCGHVHGLHDERTAVYANALVKVLERRPGAESDIQRIREAILNACEESLDLWHPSYLTNLMNLVDYYKHHHLWIEAEQKLRAYEKDSYESMKVNTTTRSMLVALGEIAVRLSGILLARNCQEEAQQVLIRFWTHCEPQLESDDLSSVDEALVCQIRKVAENLMQLRAFAEGVIILSKIQAWYLIMSQQTSEDAILVSQALARCYRANLDNNRAEAVLEDLVKNLIGLGESKGDLTSASLRACFELASLHKSTERYASAVPICEQALGLCWPSIVDTESLEDKKPATQSDDIIRLATLLTWLYRASGIVLKAERMQGTLRRYICDILLADNTGDLQVADMFSDFNESLGLDDEALTFWKEVRLSYVHTLSHQHENSMRVAFHLARFHQKLDHDDGENILIEVINSSEDAEVGKPKSLQLEAIILLCEFYESRKKHSELRKWYLMLWSSFLNQRSENGLSGEQGLDIFQKYVAVLLTLQENSSAIRVAREMRSVFVAEFGHDDFYSIKAALELAALLEADASKREEAVDIYDDVRKMSIRIGEAHADAKSSMIRRARERLAELLACRPELAHRAETLMVQAWEEASKLFGYTNEESISTLAQLIKFYQKAQSRKGTEMAFAKLEIAVRGIMTHQKDIQILFNSAEAIAKIYIELHAQHNALQLMRTIRDEFLVDLSVLHGSQQRPRDAHKFLDRRCFVFILAVEAIVRGKSGTSLFTEIVSDLMVETCLYESWMRVLQAKETLEHRLSTGGELLNFLQRKGRQDEVSTITNEMWTVFQQDLSPGSPKSGVIWQLFEICVNEMSQGKSSGTLVESAVQVALDFYQSAKYREALDLAKWIISYVGQNGGFHHLGLTSIGLRLGLCFSSGLASAETSRAVVMGIDQLSTELMLSILCHGEQTETDFCNMQLTEVNILIALLGDQKKYQALESILQSLWDSRAEQTWSIGTTISIGCRLCEAKFAAGNHGDSLSLSEDMCYNLRDVLGPLHPITVECERLRARLLSMCGNHTAAIDIHGHILHHIASTDETVTQHPLSSNEIAAIGLEEMRQLKQVYQRCGQWGSLGENFFSETHQTLVETVPSLDERLKEIGTVSSWQATTDELDSEDLKWASEVSFGNWRVEVEAP